MSKAKYAPMDPTTEIDRPGIAKLTRANITKVVFVSNRDKWGFPKLLRLGERGIYIYSLAEVKEWMKTNDLKSMVFLSEDRATAGMHKQQTKQISSAEFARLKIGTQPRIKFSGTGTSVRVRIKEQHGYEKPHSALTKFSHSGAEHRLSVSF